MIIALVGPSHAEKSKIVADINRASNGRFTRLRPLTTNPAAKAYGNYIAPSHLSEMPEENIFYSMTSDKHFKFVVLKSQFHADRDMFYVVDDPRGIEQIADLGIPYSVAYVSSSMRAIKKRAKEALENVTAAALRIKKISGRMKKFANSGEYSFFINTSVVDEIARHDLALEYLERIDEWLAGRPENKLQMDTVIEIWGRNWIYKILTEQDHVLVPSWSDEA